VPSNGCLIWLEWMTLKAIDFAHLTNVCDCHHHQHHMRRSVEDLQWPSQFLQPRLTCVLCWCTDLTCWNWSRYTRSNKCPLHPRPITGNRRQQLVILYICCHGHVDRDCPWMAKNSCHSDMKNRSVITKFNGLVWIFAQAPFLSATPVAVRLLTYLNFERHR
jgi:hypothetical protein